MLFCDSCNAVLQRFVFAGGADVDVFCQTCGRNIPRDGNPAFVIEAGETGLIVGLIHLEIGGCESLRHVGNRAYGVSG